MTFGEKLASINQWINVSNWATVAIAVLFVVSLIIAIVLTVKQMRKGWFVALTFALIVVLAISCGIDFGLRKEYGNYENQANFFYTQTHITEPQLKKVKLNTFEKAVKNLKKRDQMIAKDLQQRERQQ